MRQPAVSRGIPETAAFSRYRSVLFEPEKLSSAPPKKGKLCQGVVAAVVVFGGIGHLWVRSAWTEHGVESAASGGLFWQPTSDHENALGRARIACVRRRTGHTRDHCSRARLELDAVLRMLTDLE